MIATIDDFIAAIPPCDVCDACGCVGDLDESGSVGVADLLALLANWGPCPEEATGWEPPEFVQQCWECYSDDIAKYDNCVHHYLEYGVLDQECNDVVIGGFGK